MVAKKFAVQVSLLIIVNLIVKLVWIFFIERKIQLLVGFENYGLYYSIFNFTLILGFINDPGLTNYLIRFLASKNENSFQIANLFSLKILLSISYLLLTLLFSFISGYSNFQLIFILIGYQILWSFLIYLRGFLKGYQFLNAEVFFSILDKFLLIITLVPLFYLNKNINWTINLYALSQLIAVLISIILCYWILIRHKINLFFNISFKLNFSVLKPLMPFAIFAFLVLAYNKIDVVLLQKLLPNGSLATGNYAAAYRFLDASNMLPILFASLFYPVVSKNIIEKKHIGNFIKPGLSFLIAISLIVCFGSWFYRENLMSLFYGAKSSKELANIFGFLMFSAPLIVIYYVYSTVLTANNNLKILNIISAIGLVFNILLNIILIPNYGALGTAITSFFTFLLIGLTEIYFYYRYFKQQNHLKIWLKVLLFGFLLMLLGNFVSYLNIAWIMEFSAFVVIAIIIALVLKLFDYKVLKGILNVNG
ncbi:hypothetical protein A5893_12285 [Pedobacter psychrophilus]|uniref:Uncharacterized protein n=1 Tax=Pedobacter psychrophilus TaxID=1826909 RepID=A0A179DCQ5_9SPHI|nr:oligosaccharide flippase family protein [Pedobacter psychrophilus]OAQ38817.1 hypothetical protein A5893_12285 [Pedobacter psychrophilus]